MSSSDREELRALILAQGILRASDAQPVLSRDGTTAPWMLDSLAVTLGARGAELAGRCLLERLARFEGRQLATLGTTGIPLVQSCVLLSGGRYRGLLVRKERKAHGSRKWIEGAVDEREPVVVVDDSISSGLTVFDAIARLEEAGLRVEGAVCLVRFRYEDGFGALRERGYRAEAVFDIFADLMTRMPGEAVPSANPTRDGFEAIPWADAAAPEGLTAPALARRVIEARLSSGRVPRPPSRLAREHDGAGGVWVSLRERVDPSERPAREGFWCFPEDQREPAPRGLVLAAAKVAAALEEEHGGEARSVLEACGVGVTFFSALEPAAPGGLDDERFGIVARSRERSGVMGGALPRMPGIAGAWAQLRHARTTNARLLEREPYDLFRHEVEKVVEPGIAWPRAGAPADAAEREEAGALRAAAEAIAARADEVAKARLCPGVAPPAAAAPIAVPASLEAAFVTVRARGTIVGCMGGALSPEGAAAEVDALVEAALGDARFAGERADRRPLAPEEVHATASLVHDGRTIGVCGPDQVHRYYGFGVEALEVAQGRGARGAARSALLLPEAALVRDLDATGLAREVVDKAGITRPPYLWRALRVTTGGDGSSSRSSLHGKVLSGEELRELASRIGGYLAQQQRSDGAFCTSYAPFTDERDETPVDLPRQAHAAWVLSRAAARLEGGERLREPARRAVEHLLARLVTDGRGGRWLVAGEERPSIAESAFLLLALLETGAEVETARGLAATLWAQVDRHGRMATHRGEAKAPDAFQDYYPGEALAALAAAALAGAHEAPAERLASALRFYRHRLRCRRDWGQVGWHARAWALWFEATGEREHAALSFETADFALEHQQAAGGFVNDHQWDTPGFTSALYLEGIAAAARAASLAGDAAREARYREAWARGVGFLERLTIGERERPLLPSPERALGGVRPSLHQGLVRVDFAAHGLAALVEMRAGD